MEYSDCSNTDMRYIDFAVEEAEKSIVPYRHGCIAVSSGKIIARGHNHNRTTSRDGLISNRVCSCHAEIDVLRKCLRLNKPNKISLYIVRLGTNNNIMSSSPCIECYKQMQKFAIKSVIYSEDDGRFCKTRMRNFESSHTSSGSRAIDNKLVKLIDIL
jgi:tRNA(Arg) A34 adenosine deaminase TadA